MKNVSVADFKANFSTILDSVQKGEEFAIQYGRRKETVAMLVPLKRKSSAKRRLGVLRGRATFKLKPGFKMTEEELAAE
jgi:antitoxin (DNA-binding transcriptional repressor) of toxin-antitoxin stability system